MGFSFKYHKTTHTLRMMLAALCDQTENMPIVTVTHGFLSEDQNNVQVLQCHVSTLL